MDYNLELNRVVEHIKRHQPKTTLIQLPDGLKPKAKEIKQHLEANTETELIFWLGSCFGACDIPNVKDIDLLIQFGHSQWN